jgi:hypothetical protein
MPLSELQVRSAKLHGKVSKLSDGGGQKLLAIGVYPG